MSEITIRPAVVDDVPIVARLLSAMLDDMQQAGGLAVANETERRAYFTTAVTENLGRGECRYIVAAGNDALIGTASAEVVSLPTVFAPQRVLHISTAYVVPKHRRAGIGRRLIASLLAWGRASGCDHADLNVLVGNPARALYTDLGFADAQRKMTLRL